MSAAPPHAVRLAVPAAAGPRSRLGRRFNAVVGKLEAERVRLALWREESPKIRALASSEYAPLARTFDAHRRRLLLLLDLAYYDETIGGKTRKKLVEVICSTAQDLMRADAQDQATREIYQKHGGRGVDPDAEPSSPRKVEPAARQPRGACHDAGRAGQPVRELFRKLASALHPDREADPAERGRKTALMQRANMAYAANDLLGLLELLLEVDRSSLDNLSDDRIEQYNRILECQLDGTKVEIAALETSLALDMGWEPGRHRTPKAMMRALRADTAALRADVAYIEADLATFGDLNNLKGWLRGHRFAADDAGHGER